VESWSRREELNAPSAEYDSAALTLSYTGISGREIVPPASKTDTHCNHAIRKDAEKSAVETCLYAKSPPARQGDVVSGNQNLFESVSNFEFS
jgi:hypothetical protein